MAKISRANNLSEPRKMNNVAKTKAMLNAGKDSKIDNAKTSQNANMAPVSEKIREIKCAKPDCASSVHIASKAGIKATKEPITPIE